MGYAPSVRAIESVRTYLHALRVAKSTLTWKTRTHREAKNLIYKLHRAFASAEHFSSLGHDSYDWVVRLKVRWKLGERAGNTVTAEPTKLTSGISSAILEFGEVEDTLAAVGVITANIDLLEYQPISFLRNDASINLDDLYNFVTSLNKFIIVTPKRIVITKKRQENVWKPASAASSILESSSQPESTTESS